jgi:dolichol-phosphate mannosyltransferase
MGKILAETSTDSAAIGHDAIGMNCSADSRKFIAVSAAVPDTTLLSSVLHSGADSANPEVLTSNSTPGGLQKGGSKEVKHQTVSVIIPIYNEHLYVERILGRVRSAPLPPGWNKEIIVVDDGSTDGTTSILEEINSDRTLKIHQSVLNFGKGTAVRIGLRYATGEIVLVQDGDLEYDPDEYPKLLEPIVEGRADVVYGSRFLGSCDGMRLPNLIANKLLSLLSRVLYGATITDEATGYKAFRRSVIERIDLRCKRFEFCPEVTAKILKLGYEIHEVPISYRGRSVSEGKKIRLRDGFEAIWTLLKYRFLS